MMENPDTMRRVLGFCDASSLLGWRCVASEVVEVASEDAVWREQALRDFYPCGGAPASPLGPRDGGGGAWRVSEPCDGVDECASWRHAYWRWASLAARVDAGAPPGTSFDAAAWVGVAGSWRDLKRALGGVEASPIVKSLNGPASPGDLGRVAPKTLRYCYAVHDGQDLAFDAAVLSQQREAMRRAQETIFHGLFGGLAAYDYVVCGRLRRVRWNRQDGPGAPGFAFASNYRGDRVFSARADDAAVTVDGENAAPPGPGAFARWFRTFADRVAAKAYRLAPIVPDAPETRGVVLFPDADAGADCRVSEATTRGVRVRASAVYLPNHPSGFAYSIRLLHVGDDQAPDSCQLKTRHWIIADGDDPPRDFVGDGVGAYFPVLRRGGWRDDAQVADMALGFANAVEPGDDRDGEFVYQSFSGPMAARDGGTFAGTLEFHPGDVANPTGPKFDVACPLFRLKVPAFIF